MEAVDLTQSEVGCHASPLLFLGLHPCLDLGLSRNLLTCLTVKTVKVIPRSEVIFENYMIMKQPVSESCKCMH